MKLDDLLKDKPDLLKSLNEVIEAHNKTVDDKNKQIKYVDLSEGNYVSKEKYYTLETKFNTVNTNYESLQKEHNETKTNLENATKELTSTKASYEETSKKNKADLNSKLIELAINQAVSGLGVKDKIVESGIRASLDKSKLTVDDSLEVKGLSEQIETLKKEHKELFKEDVIKVNTGGTFNKSGDKRTYTSLDEISKLSVDEFNADRENILSQINQLSGGN